jgi:hypothetical protein
MGLMECLSCQVSYMGHMQSNCHLHSGKIDKTRKESQMIAQSKNNTLNNCLS